MQFAARHDLLVAVRGGGHSLPGYSVCEGGIMIDLAPMQGVRVDPQTRGVRAEPGVLLGALDRETQAFGLVVPAGTVSHTGVAGLTLGGGVGRLQRKFGLTVDCMVGAELVTAAGRLVRAGSDENPDLLWALQGGGGNFGVVTSFEYSLQPLGDLQLGRINVPIGHLRRALEAAASLAHEIPDELNMFLVGPVLDAPPDREPDPAIDGLVFGINLAFQGSAADAELAIEPLRELRAIPGVVGGFKPVTYAELQSRTGILPFGLRHYWKGHFLRELDGAAVDAVVAAAEARPPGHSFLLLEAITGRARHEPEGGAAFGQRGARWNASALGIWEDIAHDDENVAWVRRTADALKASSYTGAGYGNYAQADEPAERVRAAYGDDRWQRLRAVKRRYDPDNVFRFNHNIPPADA
ncbi:MAG: FAD-binding oxidoreductase [Chloroflexota bacterium]